MEDSMKLIQKNILEHSLSFFSLDQLLLMQQTLFPFITKQASLMRRFTIHLVFFDLLEGKGK